MNINLEKEEKGNEDFKYLWQHDFLRQFFFWHTHSSDPKIKRLSNESMWNFALQVSESIIKDLVKKSNGGIDTLLRTSDKECLVLPGEKGQQKQNIIEIMNEDEKDGLY